MHCCWIGIKCFTDVISLLICSVFSAPHAGDGLKRCFSLNSLCLLVFFFFVVLKTEFQCVFDFFICFFLFTSSWLYICILPQRKHHLCEEKFALHWQVSTSLLPSPLQTKLEWSVLVSVSFKLGSPETNKSVLKCCPVFLFGVFFQLILCHV